MKKKNSFYSIKYDGTLFEYKAKGFLVSSTLKLLRFNTCVCIPSSHVLDYEIKSCWLGLVIHLKLAKALPHSSAGKLKTNNIRPIWLLNHQEIAQSLEADFKKIGQLNIRGNNVSLYNIDPKEIIRFYEELNVNHGLKVLDKEVSDISKSKKQKTSKMLPDSSLVSISHSA